jgi:hypothetical protein
MQPAKPDYRIHNTELCGTGAGYPWGINRDRFTGVER